MTSGSGKRCRDITFVAFSKRPKDGAKQAMHVQIGTFMTWRPLLKFFQ